MDLESDPGDHVDKYSDPPIGYDNVRRREARPPRRAVDVHQSEDEDELLKDRDSDPHTLPPHDGRQSDGGVLLSQIQSRIQTLLPMLTSASRTDHSPTELNTYSVMRDANARFARAPSSSGHLRSRGGAPSISPHDPARALPHRRDSIMTESSIVSGQDQRQQSVQSDTAYTDGAYRRPGKHRVGESPTPEEYMALPPEAKKKVDNRLSARRSRAKRKEHVHVLTAQIAEHQNTIEMLRIENKQLNDHIANLSRAGYSLHPPPFQPGLIPHPSPHLRHAPPPIPAHMHPAARHLPRVPHPALPMPSESPRRSHMAHSPTLSTAHPSLSSGLAAAPPIGPGHVPILGHHAARSGRSEASGSFAQGGRPYDSPGRGTKREVEDERDDRLRSRMRYTSPERSNWESEARRAPHSGYRSPPSTEHGSRYRKARDQSRSPSPSPSHIRHRDLPPSLAAPRRESSSLDYNPTDGAGGVHSRIEITGQGPASDRLATLIRVHKRAIMTYQATRQGAQEGMEGLLGAAEAIGKDVEELTEEFRYVQGGD